MAGRIIKKNHDESFVDPTYLNFFEEEGGSDVEEFDEFDEIEDDQIAQSSPTARKEAETIERINKISNSLPPPSKLPNPMEISSLTQSSSPTTTPPRQSGTQQERKYGKK